MGRHSVLQLISSSGLYGAERVALELATFWREQGWRSRLCVFRHRGQPVPAVATEARHRGLEPLLLDVGGQLDAAAVYRLGRLVVDQKIELVHSHGYKTDVFLGLTRLPGVVRRVATCHTWYSRSLKLLAYEFLDKLVLHHFDHVVVVAPQLLEEVRAAGLLPVRCSLIENGVTPRPASPPPIIVELRRQLGIGAGEKLVLRVGRLDADKGNDVLLRALAPLLESQRARLVLAGEGEERPALRRLASELGIAGRVIFAGYRRDIPDLLAACDLFVISSPKEGLPMVLLEAMAAGRPIVSTAVGSIPQVIHDGVEGRLVPPGDPQSLRGALVELLEAGETAHAMAERARARFEEHYSGRAMGERYQALFEGLLVGSQRTSKGPTSGAAPLMRGRPVRSSAG